MSPCTLQPWPDTTNIHQPLCDTTIILLCGGCDICCPDNDMISHVVILKITQTQLSCQSHCPPSCDIIVRQWWCAVVAVMLKDNSATFEPYSHDLQHPTSVPVKIKVLQNASLWQCRIKLCRKFSQCSPQISVWKSVYFFLHNVEMHRLHEHWYCADSENELESWCNCPLKSRPLKICIYGWVKQPSPWFLCILHPLLW